MNSSEKRESMLLGLEKSSKKLQKKDSQKKDDALATMMRKLRKFRKCRYTGSYNNKSHKADMEDGEILQPQPTAAFDDCDEAKIRFYKSLGIIKKERC